MMRVNPANDSNHLMINAENHSAAQVSDTTKDDSSNIVCQKNMYQILPCVKGTLLLLCMLITKTNLDVPLL